jgi:transcriptional regulator with XRE-family HTH domain
LTQAEVAEAMGVTKQRVSAIESGSVAELATLADYIHALGGELTVIADFGNSLAQLASLRAPPNRVMSPTLISISSEVSGFPDVG